MLHPSVHASDMASATQVSKAKKRVRWAESDDILGEITDRATKAVRTDADTDASCALQAQPSELSPPAPDEDAMDGAFETSGYQGDPSPRCRMVYPLHMCGCAAADGGIVGHLDDNAETSWLEDIEAAEADYKPADRAFVVASDFPIEPFSLKEEREVRAPVGRTILQCSA